MNDANDTALTEAEERRFDELFSPSDRLSLTHDWKQTLHEAIRAEEAGLATPSLDGEAEASNVISLAERRSLKQMAPRVLMAAAVAVIAAFGISVLMNQSVSTDSELVQAPLLAPELEIGAPTFGRLELPENLVSTTARESGIVGLTQDPGTQETTVFTTSDGTNWTEVATLPVRNAVVDVVGDSWVVAGDALASLVPYTNAPDDSYVPAVGVFRSIDAGASWNPIPFDIAGDDRENFRADLSEITVTQLDDTVLLGYLRESVFDTTALFIENGIVGPNDRVITVIDEDNEEVLFSLGPDIFGELDVLPSDVGMTRDQFNETVDRPNWLLEPKLAVSSDGAAFVEVDSPTETFGSAPTIGSQDGRFVTVNFTVRGGTYAPTTVLVAHVSSDGRTWEKIDTDDFDFQRVELSDSWILRSGSPGLEQSLDSGDRFDLVPVPRRGVITTGAAETDFGAAVVWLDLAQVLVPNDNVTTLSDSDYTIVFEGDDVRVTDPSGVEIANQSIFDPQTGPVVVSADLQVFVLDADNQVVFASDPSWVDTSQFFGDRPPDQFISWSTDGSDWKFASLDGIGPGLWEYYPTEAGLVAIEVFEYDGAVRFEWPAEFVDR